MNKYALVIGIENYSLGSGQPEVKYAKNDADGIAQYVQSSGFRLIGDRLLIDEYATFKEIINQLDSLFDYVEPGDFNFLKPTIPKQRIAYSP